MDGTPLSDATAGLTLVNGFVLNPDRYYSPSYRASPFCTADIVRNLRLPTAVGVREALNARYAPKKWCFTQSGKEAIALSLAALNLKRDDCVTILTTSGNRYISGCVTREIEKICRWSRRLESATAAIFVNHEFGYPYRNLSELKKYNVPIIEDACHSFLADSPQGDMGRVGDFLLFSLPKIFPIQLGGLLAYDDRYEVKSPVVPGGELDAYISRVVSRYLPERAAIKAARLANYRGLVDRFRAFGCSPRFELLEHDVPGVFLFSTPPDVDLAAMKVHGWKHGIECSVFYGENAFFVPLHERLQPEDLDYLATVLGCCMRGRS